MIKTNGFGALCLTGAVAMLLALAAWQQLQLVTTRFLPPSLAQA